MVVERAVGHLEVCRMKRWPIQAVPPRWQPQQIGRSPPFPVRPGAGPGSYDRLRIQTTKTTSPLMFPFSIF